MDSSALGTPDVWPSNPDLAGSSGTLVEALGRTDSRTGPSDESPRESIDQTGEVQPGIARTEPSGLDARRATDPLGE
jgi:hypothetical protein